MPHGTYFIPVSYSHKKIGRVALIVPKGLQRTNAQEVQEYLKQNHPDFSNAIITIPDGHQLLSDVSVDPDLYKKYIINNGLKIIEDHIRQEEKFIIIDIGRYFPGFYEKFIRESIVLKDDKKFIGIVEDTENGHQKYENIKSYDFCYLMSYLCDFLITELDFIFSEHKNDDRFTNIKLELSILRAWADKIVDISSENEDFLRTASFKELLITISSHSNSRMCISISEGAIKYLRELIQDCKDNPINREKPFMDIVPEIEKMYTEIIKKIETFKLSKLALGSN